jgi:predicted nucleic acid-binding protein
MIKRLLDSVILIDHLNGIEKATRFILKLQPEQTAVSVITRAEILAGLEDDDKKVVVPLLDQYKLLIIDQPVADMAADLRRVHRWKLPDAFQAALALHHKIKLTTRNTKDFDPKKFDFAEIPYTDIR